MARAQIMVVEDEELVGLAIQEYLEGAGYNVPLLASTGEDAIRGVRESEPDLVLMDIHLKGAMNGVEAAGVIKDSFHVPVIYLTAYSDLETLEQAKATEPYGYILKPFDERSLQATIEMALYKATAQNELTRSREKLESILRSLGDGIIVTGINGMIEYFNPTAARLLRLDHAPPPLSSIFSLFKATDIRTGEPVALRFEEVVFGGRSVALGDCVLASGGQKLCTVDLDIEPHRDERGVVRGAVLAFRDVSERAKIQELINRELQAAAKTQGGLLPAAGTVMDGLGMSGFMMPASFGAGDLYDFFRIDERHLGAYMMDVMGHGVSASAASLLVSRLLAPNRDGQGDLVFLGADPRSPRQVVSRLNEFFSTTGGQFFFTLCYCVIDTETRKAKLIRAGHPYPLLRKRSEEVRELRSEGLAVGLQRGVEPAELEISLEEGDALVFYSDGLTECSNLESAQFSKVRLLSLLRDTAASGLGGTVSRIREEVLRWRRRDYFDDDVALMVLGFENR